MQAWSALTAPDVVVEDVAAVLVGGGDTGRHLYGGTGDQSTALCRYHASTEGEVYGPQRLLEQRDTDCLQPRPH